MVSRRTLVDRSRGSLDSLGAESLPRRAPDIAVFWVLVRRRAREERGPTRMANMSRWSFLLSVIRRMALIM